MYHSTPVNTGAARDASLCKVKHCNVQDLSLSLAHEVQYQYAGLHILNPSIDVSLQLLNSILVSHNLDHPKQSRRNLYAIAHRTVALHFALFNCSISLQAINIATSFYFPFLVSFHSNLSSSVVRRRRRHRGSGSDWRRNNNTHNPHSCERRFGCAPYIRRGNTASSCHTFNGYSSIQRDSEDVRGHCNFHTTKGVHMNCFFISFAFYNSQVLYGDVGVGTIYHPYKDQ
jgi:hypothetical protein